MAYLTPIGMSLGWNWKTISTKSSLSNNTHIKREFVHLSVFHNQISDSSQWKITKVFDYLFLLLFYLTVYQKNRRRKSWMDMGF